MVFTTKNREPMLNKEVRDILLKHMIVNAKKKGIWIDVVGGYRDHIHCLISLGKEQTISKVAQLIKGESSFWLNKKYFTLKKFQWQDDYWAVSVSERNLKYLRDYILNQEDHHRDSSLDEEIFFLHG